MPDDQTSPPLRSGGGGAAHGAVTVGARDGGDSPPPRVASGDAAPPPLRRGGEKVHSRASARYAAERISCRREAVRSNSKAKSPAGYSASGSAAARTTSLVLAS